MSDFLAIFDLKSLISSFSSKDLGVFFFSIKWFFSCRFGFVFAFPFFFFRVFVANLLYLVLLSTCCDE